MSTRGRSWGAATAFVVLSLLTAIPGHAQVLGRSLIMWLPQSNAMQPSTWLEQQPAHFSWWDIDDNSPSLVTCSYNDFLPVENVDLTGPNALLCNAPNEGWFTVNHYPASQFSEWDTPRWLAMLAGSAPLRPGTLTYTLLGTALAQGTFAGTPLQFESVSVFLTEDEQGTRLVNYQFHTSVVPEPMSVVLTASGLLVLAGVRQARRRKPTDAR